MSASAAFPANRAGPGDDTAEPGEAVFADGDGLEPYRRLLAVSAERLTDDGALIFQFHRCPVLVGRAELAALRGALDDGVGLPIAAYVPRFAGAAA